MQQHEGACPQKTDAVGKRPLIRFVKGLAWAIVFAALFFGVAVSSFFGGHAIGQITSGWVSPLVKGVVAIGGMTLVTWLVRVKLNKERWGGMALPGSQTGFFSDVFAVPSSFWLCAGSNTCWADCTSLGSQQRPSC